MFLLGGGLALVGIVMSGMFPGGGFHCGEQGCSFWARPSMLLEADTRAAIQSSPQAEAMLNAFAGRPAVRAAIGAMTAIETAPFALMVMSVGLALRRLAAGGREALPRALRWLRLASVAALVWGPAGLISQGAINSLLSLGMAGDAYWVIPVDLVDLWMALSLGTAAYAAVWALEAGLKAQRDLDDFV